MKNVTGLRADYDNGEGEISLPEEFKSLSPIAKKDILNDWLEELTQAYNEIVMGSPADKISVSVEELKITFTIERNEKREAWNIYDQTDTKVHETATEQEAIEWTRKEVEGMAMGRKLDG